MDEAAAEAAISTNYDELSRLYTDHVSDEMNQVSASRSALRLFVELVGPGAVTLDAGCGPGHVTSFLTAEGLSASGVDISPALLALAKQSFPELRFQMARLADLPCENDSLDAVVSKHSTIHISPANLDPVFAEFARVLRPKGRLFLSFFGSNRPEDHGTPFDHRVVTAYEFDPDVLARQLADHGLTEEIRVIRQPRPSERQLPYAALIARKRPSPADDAGENQNS